MVAIAVVARRWRRCGPSVVSAGTVTAGARSLRWRRRIPAGSIAVVGTVVAAGSVAVVGTRVVAAGSVAVIGTRVVAAGSVAVIRSVVVAAGSVAVVRT